MKILYAIQATGNGHLCRALDIIPILQNKGEVDILISGTQADIALPYPIKYRLNGMSLIFGKKGGVALGQTLIKNNVRKLFAEIWTLPVEKYDLIINDFEPVSAWACLLKRKPCFSLSHQSAVLNKNAPVPSKKSFFGRFILKTYAPSKMQFGFHFNAFGDHIFTPVIRKQVRELQVSQGQHYTVYLPAYEDKKLIKILGQFSETNWQVFSKHNDKAKSYKNIEIYPVHNEAFLKSLASCRGLICGAGFESPSEALFLKKKLLVVPMKNQYEQYCNAAALKKLGVPVLNNLKKKQHPFIEKWLVSGKIVPVDYPDHTENIIDLLLINYQISRTHVSPVFEKGIEIA